MLTITVASEAKLLETMKSLREDSYGYYVLYFHFSQLQDFYRSDYQIKIAINIVNDLFKEHDGAIFTCKDGDIIVLYSGEDKILIEKAIFQLRYLFMDDPLAYKAEDTENEDFCSVYDLAFQWKEFYLECRHKVQDMVKLEREEDEPQTSEDTDTLFRAADLAKIEGELTAIDLSKVLRFQPVCAIVENKNITRVFDEIYVNIAHLRQLLMVNVDLLSDKSLFKYLTEILDKRVLFLLRQKYLKDILDKRILSTLTSRASSLLSGPVSLNMNIRTLLSEDFVEFDNLLEPHAKKSVVLEVHISDIFSDIDAFLVARNTVQQLGYRVCIDGLTHSSITQINRENLGCDLAKLQWNADLEADITSDGNERLVNAVKKCGPNRIILCRCDSNNAISYGKALGISLFQGRTIDKFVNPEANIEN